MAGTSVAVHLVDSVPYEHLSKTSEQSDEEWICVETYASHGKRDMSYDYDDGASGRYSFTQRVLIVATVAAGFIILLWMLRHGLQVLLLAFGGLLVALFLDTLIDLLDSHAPLSRRVSFFVVLLALVALTGLLWWFLAPTISAQSNALAETLPETTGQLEQRLRQYEWGQWLLARAPEADQLGTGRFDLLSQTTGVFSRVASFAISFVIILFVGLYGAYEPGLYKTGLLKLFPSDRRPHVEHVLERVTHVLRWWLIGQFATMVATGILTLIGLLFLGVQFAWPLALIAGILEFIPNFGPVLSMIPAVLVALTQSPQLALYVVGLYIVINAIEAYFLFPLIARFAISLPPVATLIAQVLIGLLFGFLGLFFTAPLVAVAIVLIQTLYVEDVLHTDVDVLAEERADLTNV